MKNISRIIVFCLLIIIVRGIPAFATSLDELYGPLLEKGQGEGAVSFDLDRYGYDFEYKQRTATAIVGSNYNWDYIKPSFGVEAAYGVTPFVELRGGVRYSMNYGFNYQTIESNTSVPRASYDWREASSSYKYPFYLNASVDIRPVPCLDIKADYDINIYKLTAWEAYGTTLATKTIDTTMDGVGRFQNGRVSVTWLYKPQEKYAYIKSDIDGILRPLIEEGQIKINSSYGIEDIELPFAPSEQTSGAFDQEKWHKHFFTADLALGISDSLQADVNAAYYLPYTARTKTFFPATERFQDQQYKFYDSYDVGGVLRKRMDLTTELLASISFTTKTARYNTDYYNSYNRVHVAGYPYNSRYRQDVYSFKVGQTYVSPASREIPKGKVTFDFIEHPLLEKGQFRTDIFGDFSARPYKVRVGTATPTRFIYNHYTYGVSGKFSYGIMDKLELSAYGRYVFPSKYKYNYFRDSDSAPTNQYATEFFEQLYLCFDLLYRPDPTAEMMLTCGYDPTPDIPSVRGPSQGLWRSNIPNQVLTDSPTSSNIRTRDTGLSHYYLKVNVKKLF